jgi:hypothetical protein
VTLGVAAVAGVSTVSAGAYAAGHHKGHPAAEVSADQARWLAGANPHKKSPSPSDSPSGSPTAAPSAGTTHSASPGPTADTSPTATRTASPGPVATGPVWSPVWTDDFTAFPSSGNWGIYNGVGHAGQGIRSPSAFSAAGGILTITGTAGGTTGGMARLGDQRYGKWEARVRTAGCTCYHPVLILWGTPGTWPQSGEVDYLESFSPTRNNMFVHYGTNNSQVSGSIAVDMTQWHTYTVEWTPNYIAGYVDGQRFFYSTDRTIQPPSMVHATIQLDWFPGDVSADQRTGATMDVDWIKQYQYVAG